MTDKVVRFVLALHVSVYLATYELHVVILHDEHDYVNITFESHLL